MIFTDMQFRVLLSWLAISDEWGLSMPEYTREELVELLNNEAERRRYQNWIDAYYQMVEHYKPSHEAVREHIKEQY